MTSQGVLFVKENLRDRVSDKLESDEKLDPSLADENWDTEVEKQYPNYSEIPIVRWDTDEEGNDVKLQTGWLVVELESVVKDEYPSGEYVGREVESLTVNRNDSSLPKEVEPY